MLELPSLYLWEKIINKVSKSKINYYKVRDHSTIQVNIEAYHTVFVN